MKLLEDKIREYGKVLPGDILKIDGFLNHRIDVALLTECGKEWYKMYKDSGVNKILTIEASGIGVACLAALPFGVPVVYAKKSKSSNIGDNFYRVPVMSYTHGNSSEVIVSKEYLTPEDRVLIVDDFLARGCALKGLIGLCSMAGATVVGCGAVVEKVYQHGGDDVRAMGYRVDSLAKIVSMDEKTGEIEFA